MALSEGIINESLLSEMRQSNDNMVIDAINKVVRVRIAYDDQKKGSVWNYDHTKLVGPNKGKNERYILPVAYGLTKSGKRAVRAYETAGSTKRGIPHWKLFLLDNILYWSNGKKSFKEYKDQLLRLGLNTEGDKGMTTLFAITPIAKDDVQVAKTSDPITSEPISQNDVKPTTASQKPSKQKDDINNLVPSVSKTEAPIDNTKPNNYFKNKVEAPDTAPITKTQVSKPNNRHSLRGLNGRFIKSPYNFASEKPQFDINSDEWNREYEKAAKGITSEPVTKDDINNNNPVTSSYKDMMSRMDNLYKDEDEKD